MADKIFYSEIFAIWKPRGLSSNAALNILRRKLGTKHIGHAGTLDPLAEGILVVAVGREATKKLPMEVEKEKEYEAEITLGEVSETDDAEGPIRSLDVKVRPSESEIKNILPKFVGDIEQIPPAFSALKINGERAYKLARAGQAPEMKARKVLIKNIEIIGYAWPVLNIRVITGPGVYIRSLARDIGQVLRTGAYMSGLTRTRIGRWDKSFAKHSDLFSMDKNRPDKKD